MKFSTSLRTGCVKWTAPFVLLLTCFYYVVGQTAPLESFLGYAPALIATPLMSLYAFAYAVASALASWESGRLTSSGVRGLAAARSRYRVAANVLVPVVLLSWLVILAPAATSLIRATTLPTADGLRLPLMALALCVMHAVIGFGIGLRAPRLIAAPVVAVATWVLVAFTRAVQPYWLRHVSGQFGDVGFGEVPTLLSLVPPLLFAGGIAAGIALLWLPWKGRVLRILLACAVAVGGTSSARAIARDWPHTPPLSVGRAPMDCLGTAPRVCMPEATSDDLPDVRREAVSVLSKLEGTGIGAHPALITDRLADARFPRPSTSRTWHLGLTRAARHGDVEYQIMIAAVRFPCARPERATRHAVLLWAAGLTGQTGTYAKHTHQVARTPEARHADQQARDTVRRVLAQPVEQQRTWFRASRLQACRQDPS